MLTEVPSESAGIHQSAEGVGDLFKDQSHWVSYC